jgi:hypothetical protein
VFGQFTRLVSEASGWAYGIVFLFAFLDALVPVVPSEASVITAGMVAAAGGLYLPLIRAMVPGSLLSPGHMAPGAGAQHQFHELEDPQDGRADRRAGQPLA